MNIDASAFCGYCNKNIDPNAAQINSLFQERLLTQNKNNLTVENNNSNNKRLSYIQREEHQV